MNYIGNLLSKRECEKQGGYEPIFYNHKKIKALVSLAHGEGFGLPLFVAAYNGLPIVAPAWSGHVDFLSVPVKNRLQPHYTVVTHQLDHLLVG